jgi:transcriptional antiterminator RfaH
MAFNDRRRGVGKAELSSLSSEDLFPLSDEKDRRASQDRVHCTSMAYRNDTMSEALGTRWFAVYTQVNGEAKAAQNLLRQGFCIYLPRYLKRRCHARKVDFVAKPLFPRYMFVAIDMATQRWRAVQSTQGVSRLVCNGDEPAAVPSRLLGALKLREDDRGFVRVEAKPALAPGDRVRVLAGAFVDTAALFDGMGDHDRVAILLDMLGRKVRVHLDVDLVAAA